MAVFLALAIGIVLGSTELQGPTYNFLNKTTAKLQNELDQVTSQRDTAQQQASENELYAQAVEPSSCGRMDARANSGWSKAGNVRRLRVVGCDDLRLHLPRLPEGRTTLVIHAPSKRRRPRRSRPHEIRSKIGFHP